MKTKKILVTGAAGYIGSELCRLLLREDYFVVGLDSLKFGDYAIKDLSSNEKFKLIYGDIRSEAVVRKAIRGVYGIIHLAAIVGDPACSKEPQEAFEVNWLGSKQLFEIANETKSVKRFIFASTCSNYGKMNGEEYLNEKSDLNPVSLYARLKVKFEKYLLESETRKDFHPTSLRFATVYGLSPRIRFDLTINEFIRDATLKHKLLIYGEKFWRPYCHVSDLARACKLVLESDSEKVDHNVFGVGDKRENYQKKMIAEEIVKILPDTDVRYVAKEEDPRNYKVDFTKIKEELKFKITKRVPDGLKEIYELLSLNKIENPFSKQHTNI